jgi:serine/threonine-protein kinase RsbW
MDGKEVAGHCALYYWDDNPRIAEMVAGVVNPEFRSHGCLKKLTEYLIERALSEGLLGILGEAVTNHVISQRTGHQYHLSDCAVLLGMIPLNASFKGFSEMPSEKISMVMAFRYLKSPRPVNLYLPLQHENIIRKIYGGFGKSPKVKIRVQRARLWK